MLLAVLAAIPTDAVASSCYLGTYVQTPSPALACDVVVYQYTYTAAGTPTLQVHRDGEWVDVTGEVAHEQTMLWVEYPEYDCDWQVVNTTSNQLPFELYRAKIEGAYVGEDLYVDGMPIGAITDGPCAEAYPPDPICAQAQPCDWVEEDDDLGDDIVDGGGCHTSGNSCGGAAALGLLALVRRRRR